MHLPRSYGSATGLTREAARSQYGDERVASWRRSLDYAPPPYSPAQQQQYDDRRYARWQDRTGKVRVGPSLLAHSRRDVRSRRAVA